MILNLIKELPCTYDNVSKILEDKPEKNGIWIEPESREKILNYLNSALKSKYEIDENGYLKIAEYQKTNNDEILKNIIAGEKQYIIGISGITYYIDSLTGDIFDNPYEEFDSNQTYSYFTDENKMIIYIPENKDNYLDNNEIFESIIKLIEL